MDFSRYETLIESNRELHMKDDVLIVDNGLVQVPSYRCECDNYYSALESLGFMARKIWVKNLKFQLLVQKL